MTTMNPASRGVSAPQTFTGNPALNERAFARNAEQAVPTGMTATGTYLKAGFLLLLVIAAAVFGWSQVRVATVGGIEIPVFPTWFWAPAILTLVLAVAGVFARKWIAPISILYALAQGTLLGATSRIYSMQWDGVVMQAILLTVALFLTAWLLYTLGIIKVTSKFLTGLMIGMGGVLLLFLASWLLPLIGIPFNVLNEPTPLGIAVAVIIVVIAALNLPADFEFIKRSAATGAPKHMEWFGAFGLMVSIIWMYLSILRLLALTKRR